MAEKKNWDSDRDPTDRQKNNNIGNQPSGSSGSSGSSPSSGSKGSMRSDESMGSESDFESNRGRRYPSDDGDVSE